MVESFSLGTTNVLSLTRELDEEKLPEEAWFFTPPGTGHLSTLPEIQKARGRSEGLL